MRLQDIHDRFVRNVRNEAHRERLFLSLEQFVQGLLLARIPCELYVDGSFLTEKEYPDDLDVCILIDHSVHEALGMEEKQLLYEINVGNAPNGIDAQAHMVYSRDHKYFGTSIDVGREWASDYGLENSERWLKGYVVLRLWETDVGLRICS